MGELGGFIRRIKKADELLSFSSPWGHIIKT